MLMLDNAAMDMNNICACSFPKFSVISDRMGVVLVHQANKWEEDLGTTLPYLRRPVGSGTID